jgi:glycosyltransferase involved in cell wall biosynthesis
MVKILVFTPVWRRQEVFEICLEGIKRLKGYNPDTFKIIPFFVVSEQSAIEQIERFGYDWIMANNNPLGAKKNTGLKHVMENYDFDYIMEMGSDDIITNEYLDLIHPLMKNKTPQISPQSVWFIDAKTGKVAFWITDRIIGAGRMIHKTALESFTPDFEMWTAQLNKGMDTCSMKALQSKNIPVVIMKMDYNRPMILDIKTNIGLNNIIAFRRSIMMVNDLLSYFPERDMIYKLMKK